jgi:2-C-methyl-D-erythritol 2,4-cyclodiphosphate synthase/2-C-methyl-D-erythritol 4-phosphate cytidylyltransferase
MAAGSGARLGTEVPKQFLDVGGEPMVLRAARAFEECPLVDDIYAVALTEYAERTGELLRVLSKYRDTAIGADTRQESVLRGLRFVAAKQLPAADQPDGAKEALINAGMPSAEPSPLVLIHDAARPFVTQEAIAHVVKGASITGAAVSCVPATDTIYVANAEPQCGQPLFLADSPPRQTLWSVQTPQGFDMRMILAAHEAAAKEGFTATDDGTLAQRYGHPAQAVLIAMGDYANRKITTPADMTAPSIGAGASDSAGTDDRVGIGFDAHRFADYPAPLVLGGVEIPESRGLDGHSDADVLTHALMDAILGALALGDIGRYFPDTDAKYKGISSMKLLNEVKRLAEAKGYAVYNADTTIVAERPRMAPHIEKIRDSLAAALGTDRDKIGVKATTTEHLGYTAKEEGIGAQAVVRLRKIIDNSFV